MSGTIFSLEELRSILGDLLGRFDFTSVRLFGSYARGEATPASDIDLVVTYGSSSKTLDALSLGERLAERTGKSVDVFEDGEINEGPLRDAIARDSVVMYSC